MTTVDDVPATEPSTGNEQQSKTVLLVGNPNVGKTSLFNALAGLRAKTANYPGVTVDLRVAAIQVRSVDSDPHCQASADLDLVDLPGLYSMQPASPEEEVAAKCLRGEFQGRMDHSPDAVVVVVDATNLSRTLVVTSEILELNRLLRIP